MTGVPFMNEGLNCWMLDFSVLLDFHRMRQFDPKAAAFANFGINADATAHSFGAFAHDGQSYPCAHIRRTAVQPLEQTKNATLVFGGDSNAIVFDPNAHRIKA